MIKYKLACRAGHEFEGWFQSSGAYDQQAAGGQVLCPVCGSAEVTKAVMAPNIAHSIAPSIAAGETGVYVDKRHKLTRAERLQLLNQDLTYTANQLDRDVVAESQVRTVLNQFRDRVLPEAFPGRKEVPKTLIFAKDDSHADDIVRLVREVFAHRRAESEEP